MIDTKYCQLMAQYNEWMTGKVYRVCELISEAELHKGCGAFFKEPLIKTA
jgi:uncharacterized damage-inducible protein DinB